MNRKTDLVSIITPVYNAEAFVKDTIETVRAQTYDNWELLLVNDCSGDNSKKIIEQYEKKDKRIKLINLEVNSGSAIARNKAIEKSKGRYIAFLDADDLWVKKKLEKQIAFMRENKSAFIYSNYEFADENGKPNGKIVVVPKTINYNQALRNLIIWTSTVMIDTSLIKRDSVRMPNVKRGQDMATWWALLKQVNHADGMQEVTAYYRRYANSLSANKIKALQRTWVLYRQIEKMNLAKSICCFIPYVFNAIKKRI